MRCSSWHVLALSIAPRDIEFVIVKINCAWRVFCPLCGATNSSTPPTGEADTSSVVEATASSTDEAVASPRDSRHARDKKRLTSVVLHRSHV